MNKTSIRVSLLLALCLSCGNALAQSTPSTPPDWDKLSPQQREALTAPLRERWNNAPAERARMLERANRWGSMTPEQRQQARNGLRRFENMDPEQRQQARALFAKMRSLDKAQRQQLRKDWKAMTPAQRRDWAEKNPPTPGNPPPAID